MLEYLHGPKDEGECQSTFLALRDHTEESIKVPCLCNISLTSWSLDWLRASTAQRDITNESQPKGRDTNVQIRRLLLIRQDSHHSRPWTSDISIESTSMSNIFSRANHMREIYNWISRKRPTIVCKSQRGAEAEIRLCLSFPRQCVSHPFQLLKEQNLVTTGELTEPLGYMVTKVASDFPLLSITSWVSGVIIFLSSSSLESTYVSPSPNQDNPDRPPLPHHSLPRRG